MRPQLRAIAARLGGIVTRHHAKSCGYTERELKTLTKPGGLWVIVRRGVYAERSLWDAAGDDGRYVMEVKAAWLSGDRVGTPSHSSSGALNGLPLRPHWRKLVHLTRPGVKGGRTEHGIKHHTADYDRDDLVLRDGLIVMGAARSAIDIAREYGYEDGVVACDAAMRLGTSRDGLKGAVRRMTCWPNVTVARAAVDAADGGAQTIGETLMRLMILELGIGTPETQFVVREGRRHAEVDVRVRRHLFEFDGRVKYVGRERGGVADKPVEEILWDEKQREDWLRNHDGGYGMSRVIWPEMMGRQRAETMRRLEREFWRSEEQYGHLL